MTDGAVGFSMQYVETDLQRLQMKLKVEPRHLHEAIEAEYAAAAKAKPVRRPIDLDPAKSGGACRLLRTSPMYKIICGGND